VEEVVEEMGDDEPEFEKRKVIKKKNSYLCISEPGSPMLRRMPRTRLFTGGKDVNKGTEVKGIEKKTTPNPNENQRAALHKPPMGGAELEDGEKVKEGFDGGEKKGEKEKGEKETEINPRSRPATPRLKKQKKPAQDSPSMYKYVTKLVPKYENKNPGKGANHERISQEEDVAVYREKNTNTMQTLQVQEDGVAE
jgi:hypothetical protein